MLKCRGVLTFELGITLRLAIYILYSKIIRW